VSKSEKKQAASIVWFGIPADNLQRAREFYGNLFGWKINSFPGGEDYWYIDTAGADETPDGGLKKREHPQERITDYISVNSVSEFSKKSSNSAAKSAWRKRPCRRWVISLCARTPRATRSEFGRAMKMQNSCPANVRLFVSPLKRPKND
jgi:predicted enzyme related to lactoylglutathione lyase